MCLDAPRVTTPSHLPSCLSWSVSCLYPRPYPRFVFRHDLAISKCAPRPAKAIQPTQKGSLCDLNMCTAPQRDRFDPPKVRRRFALRSQNAHRATARAIRPTQSAQKVHFACSKCAPRHSGSDLTRMLKMRAAPQRERVDPPKVRRGFASPSQNAHRTTARAISVSQSDVPATKSTPRCQSTAPATKFARKAPKCRACHEIQPKRSKVLRLSRKASLQQTQNHPNCWTCHEIQL